MTSPANRDDEIDNAHRSEELDGIPLDVNAEQLGPPAAGSFRPVRPIMRPSLANVGPQPPSGRSWRPLQSYGPSRPSWDPVNTKAPPPSCGSNATVVRANLDARGQTAHIMPGNLPLPLLPPILPGTLVENASVLRSAMGAALAYNDPLGIVPIPGMKTMTIPNLPPVPGMPKVPLALGVPILHGVHSIMSHIDKWEEFEDVEYRIPYYYSRSRNVSVWEEPEGGVIVRSKKLTIGTVDSWELLMGAREPWVRVKTSTGLTYFHNKNSDELTWECPEEIVELVQALDDKAEEEFEVPEDNSEPEFEADDGQNDKQNSGSDSDSECPEMVEIRALRKKRDDFAELIREHNVVPSVRGAPAIPYERALPKFCHDARFLAVAPQDRRKLYDSTVKKLKECDTKASVDAKHLRMKHFCMLLQEDQVQKLLWDQYDAPLDAVLGLICGILGHDARWTMCDIKERTKLTREALEKVSTKVEKQKKAERDAFSVKVEAYLARAKPDKIPLYKEAREDFASAGGRLTDSDRYQIYNRLMLRQRDIHNARMKRARDLNVARVHMEDQRAKRARRDEEAELMKIFVEHCKNPWAEKVDWVDYVGDALHLLEGKSEEDLQHLWEEFKDKIVAMRQRTFLQELRRRFDREKVSVMKDLSAVLKELNMPMLSCVPETHLVGVMEKFNAEIIKDAKQAFQQYLTSSEHFTNVDSLEEKGPLFEALMDKLRDNKLFQRLHSCPADRAEMVRATIVSMKELKTNSRIVLDE